MTNPQPAPPKAAPGAKNRSHPELGRLPVCLVHDWLLGMRGGEWVLDSLIKLFPQATLHSLFYDPAALNEPLNRRAIFPSALNRLPASKRYYRWLLPILPSAIEKMRLPEDCPLVLATSHCVAHGIRPPRGTIHVSYYFTPMRYLYDQQAAYRGGGRLSAWALQRFGPRLRQWDRRAAHRADHTWCISRFVSERIRRVWDREARVIYPPVRTDFFKPPAAEKPRVDEALLVSALVPYKRVDLAIRAANRARLPLRVVGSGPLLKELRKLAGPTVTIEGWVGPARLLELYQTRSMLVFPVEEDFGIVPLEAMACGMPVLAWRAGGVQETLDEGHTGEFFDRADEQSLAEAWRRFDPSRYPPSELRAHAEQFSEARFLDNIAQAVRDVLR